MKKQNKLENEILRTMRNWLIFLTVLGAAWVLCSSLSRVGTTDTFVPMVFILAVLIISLATDGYFYGIMASLISVVGVNYAFTYPYMKLNFSIYGYPITFLTMLTVSIVISTLTTRSREQEKLRHEAAQSKLRADLLRAISHDLRTPLTSIIGVIDTVMNEDEHLSHEDRVELLGDAKQDAEWLVRMVENLLSITRISGSEQTNIEKSPELIEEILGECIANFKKRNSDVNLKVTIPDEPLMVNVDAMLIEQVIMNLLDNAAKHAEGMTELRLDVKCSGSRALVSGNNPRSVSRSNRSGGRKIIRQQQIPRHRSCHVSGDSYRPRRNDKRGKPSRGRRRFQFHDTLGGGERRMNIRDKILIVEDERSISNFLRTILTSNDYDVIVARSGAEAYSMITSHCPDLIVLDLGLPDIDGLQIIKSVREWTLLPIVVVSARAHERDKVEALDLGADDYITKPFGAGELLASIRCSSAGRMSALRRTNTR